MRMTNDKPFNFPNVLSRENCLFNNVKCIYRKPLGAGDLHSASHR